ncbi:hypothetical protein V2J09_016326 [Rumex salicifolius]
MCLAQSFHVSVVQIVNLTSVKFCGTVFDGLFSLYANHQMTNFQRSMPDEVIQCIIQYIQEARERDALSRVCRRWYELDSETRKHVTIAFCYSTTPQRLYERFPNLESLKLKGKPRAAMFNLIPENWGGYVTPWVDNLHRFGKLNSLHFRRMIVTDEDLEAIALVKGGTLQSLKLDKCSGFSTEGLLHIAQSCRDLKHLYLQESTIDQVSGEWLHELAINNKELRTLSFYLTELDEIDSNDLELIARNCPLVSLKVGELDPLDMINIFRVAKGLEEFTGGGSLDEQDQDIYPVMPFPPCLRHLGMSYMGAYETLLVFPITPLLKTLDLLCALLDQDDILMLIRRSPNLEVLEVRNVIGDEGLETLAAKCKKMKRLRVERGEDEGFADEEGVVTQRGLIALSAGCRDLEYLAVHVSDITNEALCSIGDNMKKLHNFRLVLLDKEELISDLPLDNGVRALLVGCQNLRRFALYLRKGGLTDRGLQYVGEHSQNVMWMLLGHLGETDEGLLALSRGCPNLQKLEMRGCLFSGRALAQAALQLRSLRYMWVQGYNATRNGNELLEMARDYWNIEIIPERYELVHLDEREHRFQAHPAHVFAYYSLAGIRTDFPDDGSVQPLILPPRH